ncbi:glutathione S-transferase family protein [Saccharothrix violaceirubra]|uniref:Putative glutathione S-transferase n=1 Tax=Saccharothrix violaceirubra TaxID=413306 RepID=A0A7W7T775_9PSEU|nr:glutathione S-transferase C-terminal domain-containing protein [Saccharothrix violaceirubra]MBB4967302.1 putative glutathione S-transferase [Saccharothrix violaceirubra]
MTAASPVDFETHGPYAPKPKPGATARPGPAFPHRIAADRVEPGRYHLYAATPCPFCQRSLIVRALKGLEDAVTVTMLDPMRDGRGWAFREGPGHGLDEVNGFALLSDAYKATDPEFDGHWSAPVLWDRHEGRIATNDFRTLDVDLATAFDGVAKNEIDLYPENLRADIDELNDFLYERVHNGPYRCGFAPTQEAHEKEVRALFEALAVVEERLGAHRYLFGDRITLSDIRLWVTLARFDSVYVTHFKANLRRLVDHPNLWRYARDLYRRPEFRSTTDFGQTKRHYFLTHPWINPSGLVPVGPEVDWDEPVR